MLYNLSPVRIMMPAYPSSDEFCWKCGLQYELSVLWDTCGKGTRITNDTDYYYYYCYDD